MSENTKKSEILELIEANKEVLLVMPKNNEKNISIYKEKLESLKEEYQKQEKAIVKILETRYKKEMNLEENSEIKNLDLRIATIEKELYLLDEYKTSYEKMELDKIIYKIGRYYKDNLESVNDQIRLAIAKFDEVGIKLKLEDFHYSVYVNQYMKIFFEETKENAEKLKEAFEEIYWKCSDIMVHIELNIRNIYMKNQTEIDKYYEKRKSDLLKKWGKSSEEIANLYFELQKKKFNEMEEDRSYILDKFVNGKKDLKRYSQDKFKSNCQKVLSEVLIQKMEDNRDEIIENLTKFINNLQEYKKFIEFEFIIDDIKGLYKDKETYKKVHEETKKKILNMEKELKKLSKKESGFFKQKNALENTAKQTQLILEIKEEYRNLDKNSFLNTIYERITDTSTLYEVLALANAYYGYMTFCIFKDKEISQEDADVIIERLERYIKSPYHIILNNVSIIEEKDMALMIKDRYKLLDFIVEKEDITPDTVDNLLETLKDIRTNLIFEKVELDLKKIRNMREINQILTK